MQSFHNLRFAISILKQTSRPLYTRRRDNAASSLAELFGAKTVREADYPAALPETGCARGAALPVVYDAAGKKKPEKDRSRDLERTLRQYKVSTRSANKKDFVRVCMYKYKVWDKPNYVNLPVAELDVALADVFGVRFSAGELWINKNRSYAYVYTLMRARFRSCRASRTDTDFFDVTRRRFRVFAEREFRRLDRAAYRTIP